MKGEPVSVTDVMRDLEDGVRRSRRTRLVARGGPSEYQDEEVYAHVERVLRRAVESRDPDVLLLPELAGDDLDWRLQTHLTFSSHRGALGDLIVWTKRHVLLPLTRWLYEYSLENFKRQERVNRTLFACLEELALENAKLTRQLQDYARQLQDYRIAELQKGKAELQQGKADHA